jgi:1,4-alpha-glucan branching enzyme
VVHGKGSLAGKMPGDKWRKLAQVRAFLAFMWAHPGKQLLFMGSELADFQEWSESRGLDWGLLDGPQHAGVHRLLADLNAVYKATPPLWTQDTSPSGFRWLSAEDSANNTFSFLRIAPNGDQVACIVNFSALPHENYRVGLPKAGTWLEIVNTDSELYGGSGVGNLGQVETEDQQWHGQPVSVALTVPPLGALWLKPA